MPKTREEHKQELAKKICPILSLTPSGQDDRRCLDEKCAWWDDDCDQCSIRRLASLVDQAEARAIDAIDDDKCRETRELFKGI